MPESFLIIEKTFLIYTFQISDTQHEGVKCQTKPAVTEAQGSPRVKESRPTLSGEKPEYKH